MYHSINDVAKYNFLDPVSFFKFSFNNLDKYGIIQQGNPERIYVSTFHVDRLIQDYKKYKEKAFTSC